jgi:hypothetical protein
MHPTQERLELTQYISTNYSSQSARQQDSNRIRRYLTDYGVPKLGHRIRLWIRSEVTPAEVRPPH